MAKVAHEPPEVVISTFEAVIEPPKVEWSPLADPEAVDVIFVPDIFTFPLLVAHTAFAPFADVAIVPPVIVKSPPWTNTAALLHRIHCFQFWMNHLMFFLNLNL